MLTRTLAPWYIHKHGPVSLRTRCYHLATSCFFIIKCAILPMVERCEVLKAWSSRCCSTSLAILPMGLGGLNPKPLKPQARQLQRAATAAYSTHLHGCCYVQFKFRHVMWFRLKHIWAKQLEFSFVWDVAPQNVVNQSHQDICINIQQRRLSSSCSYQQVVISPIRTSAPTTIHTHTCSTNIQHTCIATK